MDIKKIFLTQYQNATNDFLIRYVNQSTDAIYPHTHDYFQLYYISRGQVTHHIDKQSARLKYGDTFIIPPNVKHFITLEEKDTAFYALSFTPAFLEQSASANVMLGDFLKLLIVTPHEKLRPRLSLQLNDTLLVESLMERIMKEFNERNIGSWEIIREASSLLITLFSRNYFSERAEALSRKFISDKQSVLACVNYISEHCTENITLDGIAKSATMSKASFCKTFLEITGLSFKNFLNGKRIEKALEYIKEDKYKITTVGSICGYSDFSTFYRNFKKFTGISPQDYKRCEKKSKN